MPEEVQDGEHVCSGPSGGLELGDHDGHKALQVGGEQVLLHGAGAGQQPQAGLHGVGPHYQVAHLVDDHTVAPALVHKELHSPGHHVIVCIKHPGMGAWEVHVKEASILERLKARCHVLTSTAILAEVPIASSASNIQECEHQGIIHCARDAASA